MAHKYLVDLTEEERGYLLDVIRKGKTTARRVARAHVLLRAAEGATDEEIAETLRLGLSTVHRTRQRFVDEGLTVALTEQSRSGLPPALTGKQAAFLIALAHWSQVKDFLPMSRPLSTCRLLLTSGLTGTLSNP